MDNLAKRCLAYAIATSPIAKPSKVLSALRLIYAMLFNICGAAPEGSHRRFTECKVL
jgi:hypothetical protein